MGWTVVILAGVVVAPLVLMYVFQRGMIYMPVAELPPNRDTVAEPLKHPRLLLEEATDHGPSRRLVP